MLVPTSGMTTSDRCMVLMFWPDGLWQNAVGVLTIVVQYLGPLFLFNFFYARMTIKLRQIIYPAGSKCPGGGPGQPRVVNSIERERKNILKKLTIVVCSLPFCWTWNQIFLFIFNLGGGSIDFTRVFYYFTVVMVFLNCCINPSNECCSNGFTETEI